MSELREGGAGLGVRYAIQQLDGMMERRGVKEETRAAVTNSMQMMYEYIPYAIKQGKDPSDGKVLADFLMTKGMNVARYLGNDSVNCGLAIVDLVKSMTSAANSTKTGNAPLITLTWGLAMLDLLEVGNSCEPAQQVYYELFLKESTVKLSPVRRITTLGSRP